MIRAMARVNRLVEQKDYIGFLERIDGLEKERFFCKHGFEHGLNVARIAYAYLLEKGVGINFKEVVYAAALLHDIGRWIEYETGEDHSVASARLALPLLEKCGFEPKDIQIIIKGIREHRLHNESNLSVLGEALTLADNWARDCRCCSAQTQCHKFTPAMKLIIY